MDKILVTGGNGFTGKYITSLLRQNGYTVVNAVRRKLNDEDVVFDGRSIDSIKRLIYEVKPNGIIHLAGISFARHKPDLDFYENNILLTERLLAAIDESKIGIRKIILASSATIYEGGINGKIHEHSPIKPRDHYSISKMAMEIVAQKYIERFKILITRPFNYIGVGQRQDFVVSKIAQHFKSNKEMIELGNIDVSRDFTDVRDIAVAYKRLYESDEAQGIVNICSSISYSIRDVISIMEDIARYKIEVITNPKFVRANETKTITGDNSKLFALTNFRPSIPMVDTLDNLYKSA